MSRADMHDIPYASRYEVQMELPKYKMPENGVESKVVYQLLHDELELGTYILSNVVADIRWESKYELGVVSPPHPLRIRT
jgi:glutamate/tyrosine decarboxylase-like PLP-dependent enzyme